MSIKQFRYLSVFLPAIGGAVYALSNVGYNNGWLSFFALPFLWYGLSNPELDTLPQLQHLKKGFGLGFIFGLCAYFIGFQWLFSLNNEFISASVYIGLLFWLVLGVWFAMWFGLYGLLYSYLKRSGVPFFIYAIAPLLIIEGLQKQLFPSYLGAALVESSTLVQISDLGGPLLLSAFVATVSLSIFSFLQTRKVTSTIPAILCLVAAYAYGSTQLSYFHNLEMQNLEIQVSQLQNEHPQDKPLQSFDRPLTIGIVQSNLVKTKKKEHAVQHHHAYLAQSRELLRSQPDTELLIWPETAYEQGLRRPLPLDAQFIVDDIDVPLLFGATSIWQEKGQKVHGNSVLLVDQDRKVTQAYDKQLLIPFAETLPFGATINQKLKALFPFFQAFKPGTSYQPFHLKQWKITTPICYEIIHPAFVRESLRSQNSNLIITLANDSWFENTREPMIHLRLAKLRAIEHKRWLVRATNNGISALVSPTGQTIAQSEFGVKASLTGKVYANNEVTLFSQYGNWLLGLALIACLASLLQVTYRSRVRQVNQLESERLTEEG